MKLSLILAATAALFSNADAANAVVKRGSPGCGKMPPGTNKIIVDDQFHSRGQRREYRLYIPKNYKQDVPAPLIFGFHATHKRAPAFERKTRFVKPEINPDHIVIYPHAIDQHWEGASWSPKNVSDKAYVMDLLDHVKNELCVDEDRVYGVGHTGGAGLVNMLACDPKTSKHFAAMSLISATLFNDLDDSFCKDGARPMPMFELHGTADTISPYKGSNSTKGGPVPPIADWFKRWAVRNGCDDEPYVYRPKDVIETTSYNCSGVPDMVKHLKVIGHGHFYMDQATSQDISPWIMDFLGNHTRSPCRSQ